MEKLLIDGIERKLNLKPSRAIQRDWGYRGQRLPEFPGPSAHVTNWLPANWMAFDQLDTGTCAGNAASGLVYCQTGVILSRLQLWLGGVMGDQWDLTVPGCLQDGTSLKAVLDYLRKVGAVPEIQWPFWPLQAWYKGSGEELLAESKKHRIDSYYYLGKDQDLWRLWLSNYGPIYMGIQVDLSYCTPNREGLLQKFKPETTRGGHAIYCSGYQDGLYNWPGSWGSNIADKGVWHPNAAYADAAVTEAYGVIVK